MSAVENQLDYENPNDISMKQIGPDQAKAPVVDIRAQFGSVAFDAKGREIQMQQPQVQAQQQQPDPWANTGQGQTPIMDRMQAAANNFDTTCKSMQQGAGYVMGQACQMGSELISGIGSLFKSPEPQLAADDPQLAMNRNFVPPPPQPGNGFLNM